MPEATCITREQIFEDLNQYSAIAVGPGLGSEISDGKRIKKLLEMTSRPVVLDADGLNLMQNDLDALKGQRLS